MKDIYTQVTNSIITALEQGAPPWARPWRDGTAMPSNLATGKPYRGINFVMLNAEAMRCDYSDNRWLTFNQATDLGMRIRKGEHGTPIVFYRLQQIKDSTVDDAGDMHIPMLKIHTVFNAGQMECVPERFALCDSQHWQSQDFAEQLLHQAGAVIRHGGRKAFYSPRDDFIKLPPTAWFSRAEDYYATAFHELCHWTGHPSRLNRVLKKKHGIEAYAYEELVAEIGAAFLCAHSGISARLEHVSYINDWLDALRRDKRLIFAAAGAAQKAADFVLRK